MGKKRNRGNPRRARRGLPYNRGEKDQRSYVVRFRSGAGRIQSYLRHNWSVVRTCLLFAAYILVFMLLYWGLTGGVLLDDIRSFTAQTTAFVLNLFGGDVKVDGPLVYSPHFSMGIIEACTGIIPLIIFSAAVLAYPSTIRSRAIGIAFGLVGIYTVNTVRTTTLFVVGTHLPGFFDTAHYLMWQSLMILVAVAFWLLWMSRLANVAQR